MCKTIKRFLCIVLACCMLAPAFMFMATLKTNALSEEQYVAKVGNTSYEKYQDAWAAVASGGTITMLADWHTSEVLTVNNNINITVNMNGYMINRGLADGKENGAIFLINENGLLTLNGNGVNSTERWGTVRSGKWKYQENGQGTVKINGSLLTGGYNNNGGGAIHILKNACVKLDGVTLAGNACSEDSIGGVIRLQEQSSKLYLTNSSVSYNRADNGGGSAIWVEGVDSYVEISNTEIHHNFVDVDYGDGGAIQINDGSVKIKNSEIAFNEASRNGGAIYIYNGNLIVDKETVMSYNIANQDGGAIYVNSKADNLRIEGRYIGNRAAESGGVIYVNNSVSENSGVRIANAEMIGNIAGASGGAAYVDSDNTVALSGNTVMHGNSPDNLHIKATNTIVENNLSDGSRIGLFTSLEPSQGYAQTSNHQYFFSDMVGYKLESRSDKIYFVKDSEGASSTYNVGNTEYELRKGSFNYTSVDNNTINSYFYYSDGYFAESPKYYNEHLASLAASMALAAIPMVYEGEYSEEKSAKHIIDMFVSIGYSDIYIHYPEPKYFGEGANLSTIGYAIAKKTIIVNGEEKTSIAVALRGVNYYAEWVSNVTIGDGFGEAKGFSDSARQVREGIDAYIKQKKINTDSVKFLITGYSRAGAVSNLVAKKLTDSYGENSVYAYCFAAPKGGVSSELKDGFLYTNIHNVINSVDIITTLGTKQMGFIRYGVDHNVPSHKVGTDAYDAQRMLMRAQLLAINKHIEFDDEFSEATVEYVASTVDFTGLFFDLIDPEWMPDYNNAEDWVPDFVEKLQEYSMTDMTDKSSVSSTNNAFNNDSDDWYGYRNFYANYKWYMYFDEADENKLKIKGYVNEPDDFDSGKYTALSLEDAIVNLVLFYYDSSPEKKNAIADAFDALDLEVLMEKVNVYHIWRVIIADWHKLSIDRKNEEFNSLWRAINSVGQGESSSTLESDLKQALSDEEYKRLMMSFYVVADFFLDFVAEDYCYSDQNFLGTAIYNIDNIVQTHYYDVAYSWVRSYDSFYINSRHTCNHRYGDWHIVKAASVDDYGVQMKSCLHCGENVYEAIPKMLTEDNILENRFAIVTGICLVILVAAVIAGVTIYIWMKINKKKIVSAKMLMSNSSADEKGE